MESTDVVSDRVDLVPAVRVMRKYNSRKKSGKIGGQTRKNARIFGDGDYRMAWGRGRSWVGETRSERTPKHEARDLLGRRGAECHTQRSWPLTTTYNFCLLAIHHYNRLL